MIKTIAIRDESFKPAYDSARNFFASLVDLLYGTEERVKLTYAFAMALLVLGISLMPSDASSMGVCAL